MGRDVYDLYVLLFLFWFEFDHDTAQRLIANVLCGVNYRRVKRDAVGDDIYEDLGLPIRPLLKPRAIELHDYPLTVAVARSRIAYLEPFLKDKKSVAVVTDGILFRRDDFGRRLHRWVVWFDANFEEWPSRWRVVIIARFEDSNVATFHFSG